MRPTNHVPAVNERNDALRAVILSGNRLEGSARPTERLNWSKIITARYDAWLVELAKQSTPVPARRRRRRSGLVSRPS